MKNSKISIALTGHTTERLNGKEKEVHDWIKDKLKDFFKKYDKIILICGGADGADTIFGNMIFDPDFRSKFELNYEEKSELALYLPSFDYREKELTELIKASTFIVALKEDNWNEEEDFDLYYERDTLMIDDYDVLLAIWDGIPKGGTYNNIQYALSKNKPVIFIDENIFKE